MGKLLKRLAVAAGFAAVRQGNGEPDQAPDRGQHQQDDQCAAEGMFLAPETSGARATIHYSSGVTCGPARASAQVSSYALRS